MSPTTSPRSSLPNVPRVQLFTESVIAAYINEISDRRVRPALRPLARSTLRRECSRTPTLPSSGLTR
jgi:hypothetical protein